MNLYTAIGARVNSPAALALSRRLAHWHDAMVAHERPRSGRASTVCDEDCPHGEASALWSEALATYGEHAHELSFLRARSLAMAA
jgi:hypothetical protein